MKYARQGDISVLCGGDRNTRMLINITFIQEKVEAYSPRVSKKVLPIWVALVYLCPRRRKGPLETRCLWPQAFVSPKELLWIAY